MLTNDSSNNQFILYTVLVQLFNRSSFFYLRFHSSSYSEKENMDFNAKLRMEPGLYISDCARATKPVDLLWSPSL